MVCLHLLLENGLNDSALPLEESHRCHRECRGDFKRLLENQGSFLAARFKTIGEHQQPHTRVVIPLQYCSRDYEEKSVQIEGLSRPGVEIPSNSTEEATTKKAAFCGGGAFTNVYCVKIDPDHHELSKVNVSH